MDHRGTQRLETERLILRRFALDDASAMFRNWASDGEVTRFLTWPTHKSVETTQWVLDSWIPHYEENNYYHWAITLRENGDEPVGDIAAVKVDDDTLCAEIGYCLGRKWWHKGIMPEALKAVEDFLFDSVGFERVEARHDVMNPNSGRVMLKCGMKYEGTLRASHRNNRGVCDVNCYALLKSERQPSAPEESEKQDFFSRFVSCTAAGSGSQNWFGADPGQIITCRVYYRLSRDTDDCALLYSNLIDSTYADGSHSHANFVPGYWTIHSLRAGRVSACGMEEPAEPEFFTQVTFGGQTEKRVNPGELFSCDPFRFPARKGEYMCVEMAFSGAKVPCHTESLLPAFRFADGSWTHSTEIPFPCMVAAKRKGETRLGFIGDSITQGIGTPDNSYTHVAARVQEALGEGVAVWDLGLGYGRGHDAALDGSWLYRARQNDVMCVCFGVNDLFQLGDAELLKKDLTYIVRALKQAGLKVLLQTVPPFDYAPEFRERWLSVNDHIKTELAKEADAVFDCVPMLSRGSDTPWLSRYGAHPDAEGNAAWAEKLLPTLKKLL